MRITFFSACTGFALGSLLWACSEPSKGHADTVACDCSDEIAKLEARIALLEASSVQQSGGEALIPAASSDHQEGGQINLSAATDYGIGYNLDVYQNSFRVIQVEDNGANVVFGWDGPSNSFVVYGDMTVRGTVTATEFQPG